MSTVPFNAPTLVVTTDALRMEHAAPFDRAYPALTARDALCVGIRIDWSTADSLHALARSHTLLQEHARADRFFHAEDRLRHLLGRALLRRLASYYGDLPTGADIPVNPWGKPEPLPGMGLNLSHSGDWVWAVASHHRNTGIDVESLRETGRIEDIIDSLHPAEARALRSMEPGREAMHATLRCWTRKEAIAKATGQGLSLSLHAFEIDCGPAPCHWLRKAPEGTPAEWTTADLPVDDHYTGALAIEGRCERIYVTKLISGINQG